MEDSVSKFYDGLADKYHLMFADWREEVMRQGATLDRLIRSQLGNSAGAVLDCACGIGTQAIGLAKLGYKVHATDFSPAAVERARREAASFGATLTFDVADFRALDAKIADTFDVVLCGDNSLSHLLEDADLLQAASQMKARLRPGGLLLASIRDYDRLLNQGSDLPEAPGLPGIQARQERKKPGGTMPQVFDGADGRRIAFQVWDWAADERSYAVHQFFLRESEGAFQTTHHLSRFRALLRRELSDILRAAGFSDIHWHTPDESGFYQPLVSARA